MNSGFKGVIFDFNGTLFWDSEKHLRAWRDYSARLRGIPFSDEEMYKYMFGRTNEDIIAYALSKKPDKDLVKKLADEKEELYRDMCRKDFENTHLADGAVEYFEYLLKHGIKIAIATMSEKPNVDFYIEQFNLLKWFKKENIIYSDGTVKGKPAPDIFIKAAKSLNLEPCECIIYEDALSGLMAAKASGAGKVIAVTSMHDKNYYEQLDCVDEIISDFTQLCKSEV